MKRTAVVFLVLATFCSAAQAEPLRLATGNQYPPFADENLPGGGLATRLVEAAFAAVDTELTIEFMPWQRGYRDTLGGEIQGTFPYIPAADRVRDMLYSDPLIRVRTLVISRADNPLVYQIARDLLGRELCWPLGWALPSVVETLVRSGEISYSQPREYNACPRMLATTRVDFMLSNNFQWHALVESEGLNRADFYVAEQAIQESTLHFIAPRTPEGERVVRLFNAGLKTIRENGEYDAIMAVYDIQSVN
ncbi:transporter substrate-binding domain-containing protein [Salinispirillum sp. LH 10-3-1]|uniref:Transporter substrate-binding domain-containing protein n=1 Tax=Salinispirillum sp. LH 10-3-1 TaxID=2952525 RepID=A0AB38YHC4_9GAMM